MVWTDAPHYVVRALPVLLKFIIHNGIPSDFFREALGLKDITVLFRIYLSFILVI